MPQMTAGFIDSPTRLCLLGAVDVGAFRTDLFILERAFPGVYAQLEREVYVVPARGVEVAARHRDLRSVLLQDHPLHLQDCLDAVRLVEVHRLGVDQLVDLDIAVVVPVAHARHAAGMVEAQRSVRLIVRQIREEGHVVVAGQDYIGDECAQLNLVEKQIHSNLAQLVLQQGGQVGDERSARHPGDLHLRLEALFVAGGAQELPRSLRIERLGRSQLVLRERESRLQPLDGSVIVAFPVPDQVDDLVTVYPDVDRFSYADVRKGLTGVRLEVDYRVESRRRLHDDEVRVFHSLFALCPVHQGPVDVVLTRVERGEQRLWLGDDDVPDLLQPRSRVEEVFRVPREDYALGPPKLTEHVWTAAPRLLAETIGLERTVLVDHLGRDDRQRWV